MQPTEDTATVPSLPSRERGLKYSRVHVISCGLVVAPFAGAWIEIPVGTATFPENVSRSLRGSVD